MLPNDEKNQKPTPHPPGMAAPPTRRYISFPAGTPISLSALHERLEQLHPATHEFQFLVREYRYTLTSGEAFVYDPILEHTRRLYADLHQRIREEV